GCSPVLETTAATGDQQAAVVGVRWSAAPALFSYWQLDGRWPQTEAQDVCLLGARVAKALKATPGSRLTLAGSGGVVRERVAGIIRAGDQADDQCFVTLSEAQRLAGRPGMASMGLA